MKLGCFYRCVLDSITNSAATEQLSFALDSVLRINAKFKSTSVLTGFLFMTLKSLAD